MRNLPIAAALVATACAFSLPAVAQGTKEASPHTVTANVGLASEYRYRGIGQTNARPALQGGVDYAHASGGYAGVWGSNVSWLSDAGGGAVSNSVEIDVYGGYKGSAGGIGYDLGLLQYWYPGSYPGGFTRPNTTEAYVAASWQAFTLKYSHALTNVFGFPDSRNAGYLDLGASFDVGNGVTLVAHAGHQRIPGTAGRSASDCSYTDWKLGLTKDAAGFTWGLSYVDTDAKGGSGQCYRNAFGRDLGKGTVVLTAARTF